MAPRAITSARRRLLLALTFSAANTVWAHGGGGDSDSDGDGGGAKPDLRTRGLVAVKLWCLALVFAGTLAGGVSPYFMRWNEAFLALGTQFAGGVFLGTALMHFLSDANETFEDLLPDSGYPYAFLLACAGYVVTMLADCVISFVVSRGRGTAPGAGVGAGEQQVTCLSPICAVAGELGGVLLSRRRLELSWGRARRRMDRRPITPWHPCCATRAHLVIACCSSPPSASTPSLKASPSESPSRGLVAFHFLRNHQFNLPYLGAPQSRLAFKSPFHSTQQKRSKYEDEG
ncbi:zinc transporter 2-like isoform X4 [Phragmites australis]|uniref:zinc transporter 2-like isoform X4 n=1 Tax=Phragmites australis TaxID=29695 RepID=UPI002D7803CA|nr:zinc transporter 2-like isoform X4 [Phragmites australis]